MKKTYAIILGAALCGMACANLASAAVDWPKKTIQLICPYKAGGDSDALLRAAAPVLAKDLGVNVVVSNVTGSGTLNAMREVKANEPDGYNVLYYNSTLLGKQAAGSMKGMSLTDDFVPAGAVAYDATYAMVVRADSGIKKLSDVVDRLKVKPKSLTFAITNKAATHYLMLSLQDALGVEFNGIDAGSDNASRILSLLSGEVDVILGNYSTYKDYIADGQMICLGIMADDRNPAIPDVPTLKEQGCNVNYKRYYSYRFLKGTDPEIVAKFSSALERVKDDPAFKKVADSYIVVCDYLPPEKMQEFEVWAVEDQAKYWKELKK